jgi:hypothetical protein
MAAISTEWSTLVETSKQMLAGSLGIVDSAHFLKALERARCGQEIPIVSLMRVVRVEHWLKHLGKHGVLQSFHEIEKNAVNHWGICDVSVWPLREASSSRILETASMKIRYLSAAIVVSLLSAVGLAMGLAAEWYATTPKQCQSQTAIPNRSQNTPRVENPATSHEACTQRPPMPSLPSTLDPQEFTDNKNAFVVYSLAAKIRALLYHEPCYCQCVKERGHKNLLDCFAGRHGIWCEICHQQAIFVYEQSKLGKTAAEIRVAMKNGDAWRVDVKEYIEAHYAAFREPRRWSMPAVEYKWQAFSCKEIQPHGW